jgi:phosphomannomutase / phosphoglucomutase
MLEQLTKNIFKAYDIRGIVDETLTEQACRAVGRALAVRCTALGITRCVVGRDGRLSGPRLAAAVAQGLNAGGIDVADIGLCTTPVVYWGTHHLATGTGVMVTGSHNPPQYNGLKMMLGGGALYGDDIQMLYELALGFMEDLKPVSAQGLKLGSVETMDLIPPYTARVVGDTQLVATLKIVMDCGNGAAGAVAPALIKALGVEVIELFSEVDGNFPNHHPDPAHVENLQDLILALQASDADVGIAFDGDGDRLGVVTRSGEVIFPDRQLMLFAADVLSRNPGAPIVYDVKCSRLVGDVIAKNGGQPVMWKTGHSLIKVKMKELNSPLAGEMSGHIFFNERWYGFDDGVYAAVRLLEILAHEKTKGRTACQVLEGLPNSTATPEINVMCAEGEAHALCAQLQTAGKFENTTALHTMDGVRAEWADGFGLARASNTTPVIVLRFEADNASALARIQAVFARELRALKPTIQLAF